MRALSSLLLITGCALGLMLLSAFLLDAGALSILILIELNAIVALGVSLVMGYAGQVSLGQSAFCAAGAYATALLSLHGTPTVVGLLAAPLVAAGLAFAVGVPLLRLRGHHLAFATLAAQLMALSMVGRMQSTGGDIGLQGIPRLAIGPLRLDADRDYALIAWLGLVLLLVMARNLIGSRPGRALRALATNEAAAESSGVATGRYKLAVFAMAAAYAGLAGGIYVFYLGYVAPGCFPALLSFEYVVMAVVGGLGSLEGALVGAIGVTLVVQLLSRLATSEGMPSYAPAVMSYAIYSSLLIVIVLFLPKGLAGLLGRSLRVDPYRSGEAKDTAVPDAMKDGRTS